jgi:cell division protein FtsW
MDDPSLCPVPSPGALRIQRERPRWLDPRDVFITCVFILVAVGTVMVFSASAFHWSVEGDAFFFLRRQLAWLPIAVLGCVFFRELDYRLLRRYYWQPLAAAIVLLAVVLVPSIGRDVNASRRWLPLGEGLQFQPSELAKLAVIIFLAGFIANDPSRRLKFWRGFAPACGALLPVFALILIEPDFGTALFVLGLGAFVLFLAGMRLIYLAGSVILFAPIIAAFAHQRWETIKVRLLGFTDPESIYQVKHSLTALGSGGLLGLGLGASGQKLKFLPEPHTDFILSILGEELGLAGTVGVVLLFVVLLWSGMGMVWRARDAFGFLLGAGIIVSLSFQAALNIAVVTASAPTKGIPLPFLTFGGSGLCVTLAQVGILLSIDRAGETEAAGGPERRGP